MAGCGSFQSAVLSTSLKQLLEGSSQGLQCRGTWRHLGPVGGVLFLCVGRGWEGGGGSYLFI